MEIELSAGKRKLLGGYTQAECAKLAKETGDGYKYFGLQVKHFK